MSHVILKLQPCSCVPAFRALPVSIWTLTRPRMVSLGKDVFVTRSYAHIISNNNPSTEVIPFIGMCQLLPHNPTLTQLATSNAAPTQIPAPQLPQVHNGNDPVTTTRNDNRGHRTPHSSHTWTRHPSRRTCRAWLPKVHRTEETVNHSS